MSGSHLKAPPCYDLQNAMYNLQQASTDIALYAPLVGQMVSIAWPTVNGSKVPPDEVVTWLAARGLLWCCFCAAKEDTSTPMRVMVLSNGEVLALCHYEKPLCSSSINLSKISSTTTQFSDFPNLPTLESSQGPSTCALVAAFIREADEVVLPFFDGYAGEHIAECPGTMRVVHPSPSVAPQPESAPNVEGVEYSSEDEGSASDGFVNEWLKPDPRSRARTRIIRHSH